MDFVSSIVTESGFDYICGILDSSDVFGVNGRAVGFTDLAGGSGFAIESYWVLIFSNGAFEVERVLGILDSSGFLGANGFAIGLIGLVGDSESIELSCLVLLSSIYSAFESIFNSFSS